MISSGCRRKRLISRIRWGANDSLLNIYIDVCIGQESGDDLRPLPVRLEQFDHPIAHRLPDVEVGLAVLLVVVALIPGRFLSRTPVITRFDGLHVSLELGILPLVTADGELGVGDRKRIAFHFPASKTNRRNDKRGVWRLEVFAKRLDETYQVLLVPRGIDSGTTPLSVADSTWEWSPRRIVAGRR